MVTRWDSGHLPIVEIQLKKSYSSFRFLLQYIRISNCPQLLQSLQRIQPMISHCYQSIILTNHIHLTSLMIFSFEFKYFCQININAHLIVSLPVSNGVASDWSNGSDNDTQPVAKPIPSIIRLAAFREKKKWRIIINHIHLTCLSIFVKST